MELETGHSRRAHLTEEGATRIGLGGSRPRIEPATIALGVILLLGLLLRVYFLERWRPALLGFPDTTAYLQDAHSGLFDDPLRVGGYAEFLRLMHGIGPHLSFAILVQHMLGLASGLLLFGAVRRAGFPVGLGLVPAAVVMLGGSELFIEHTPLTEAVFISLVCVSLYALVRAWRGHWLWAIPTGLALGAGADVRSVGLVLAAGMAVIPFLVLSGGWRPRLLRATIVVLAAAIPIGAYLKAHEDAVGYGGFTGDGYFDLYARVAPFAECSRFHAPIGTGKLCIDIPRSKREGHDVWEFTGISPAVQLFGKSYERVPRPGENSKLRAFAEAAILGQPVDYLQAVGRDLVRIVDPSFSSSPYGGNAGYGNTPESLTDYYFNPRNFASAQKAINEYYPGEGESHGSVRFLRSYERDTRIEGPLMAVLLLLALAAPIFTNGDRRRASLLFFLATLILLTAPIFTSEYDYRFTIPAFGPLATSAAIGGWAVGGRVRAVKSEDG